MTHPTDDEIMELAGSWFHTGENQKRDDGYYYRSLGTPSNVRGSDLIEFARALLAEQARTQTHKLDSQIHDSSATHVHATVDAACWGEYTIEASRDDESRNWYITVTAPSGIRDYDGYWRNSDFKTVDEVINEAIAGACLTPVAAPLLTHKAEDAPSDAELADTPTPKPQGGMWTLTAPDGRTYQADSPLRCCGLEQRERVPADVAMARIFRAASEPDDSELLDWLDATNKRFKMGWKVGVAPAGNCSVQSIICLGNSELVNIRAAIRAAIAQERKA